MSKQRHKVKLPEGWQMGGFVRLDHVLEVYPVSRRTWYRGIAAGRYPQPVELSPNVKGWLVDDILELLSSVIEQRNQRLRSTANTQRQHNRRGA